MRGKTTRQAYEIAEKAVRDTARKIRKDPNLSEDVKNHRILRHARTLDGLRKRHGIKE